LCWLAGTEGGSISEAKVYAVHAKIAALEERFERLEGQSAERAHSRQDAAISPTSSLLAGPSAACHASDDDQTPSRAVQELEQKLQDLVEQVGQAAEDGRDMRTRFAAQEEQFKMLRTTVEAKDNHLRMLSDRVGSGDWVSKFESIRQALQEESKLKIEWQEKLQLLARRMDLHEQVQEEIRDVLTSGAWAHDPYDAGAEGVASPRSAMWAPGMPTDAQTEGLTEGGMRGLGIGFAAGDFVGRADAAYR